MNVGALDMELEPEFGHITKKQLGIHVSLGQKLLDVLVFSAGQNTVKVPLSASNPDDKLVLVVKNVGGDGFKAGSISIPLEVFYNAGESQHKQWITLFDHIDDDEYDGEMGENDDEAPRVYLSFEIYATDVPPPKIH